MEDFDLKTLLLAAIKSEIDAKRTYSTLASRVKNAFLKDRLNFLASEEEKHRATLENVYKMHFSDTIVIPESTPVPLPEPHVDSENDPISLVMEDAMESERAAEKFYMDLAERFDDEKTRNILEVLAQMEHSHYDILNAEYENIKRFEDYDTMWPMMHAGP